MTASASGVILEYGDDGIDITILQGKTLNFSLIWGGVTPIDVTGWTSRMQIRKSAGASEVIASFTNANSRVITGGVNGKFAYTMTATDCAALSVISGGVYDIELIDTAGNVYQGESGKCNIVREVTR